MMIQALITLTAKIIVLAQIPLLLVLVVLRLALGGFGGGVITIPDYLNANKNTSLYEAGGVNNKAGASRGMQGYSDAVWDDTAALTKITLTPQNDDWLRGTTFTLYGIKSS